MTSGAAKFARFKVAAFTLSGCVVGFLLPGVGGPGRVGAGGVGGCGGAFHAGGIYGGG
jgi:hypothetical protein